MSRRQSSVPRCHQKTTSSAAGSVAVTVLLSSAEHEQRERERVRARRSRPRRIAGMRAPRRNRRRPTACSSARSSTRRIRPARDAARRSRAATIAPRHRRAGAAMTTSSERGQCVQRDVDEVVAERVVAPERGARSRTRVRDRVVLLRRADIEPDRPEPVQRSQRRAGDVPVVVPQQAAVPGGVIGKEQRGEERREHGPRMCGAPGKGAGGGRLARASGPSPGTAIRAPARGSIGHRSNSTGGSPRR